MRDKYGFSETTLLRSVGLSQDELIAGGVLLARELRALKAARVDEAKTRLRGLRQLKAQLDIQIQDAQRALDDAERDAKE